MLRIIIEISWQLQGICTLLKFIFCIQLSDDSTTSLNENICHVAPPASSTAFASKKDCINVILRSGEDLQWDQKIHLVGRCVKDPAMHICESCSLPVLIYGRMVSPGQILQIFIIVM